MYKGLEFFLSNMDISLTFYLMLILLPLKQGCVFVKSDSKQYFLLAYKSSNDKIVFILLKNIIRF